MSFHTLTIKPGLLWRQLVSINWEEISIKLVFIYPNGRDIYKLCFFFFLQGSISQTQFRRKPQIKTQMKLWHLTDWRQRTQEFLQSCLRAWGNQVAEIPIWCSNLSWALPVFNTDWKGIWRWSSNHKWHFLHRKGANHQLRPPKLLNLLLSWTIALRILPNPGSERKYSHPLIWA